ncbi:hypothetical protein H5410_021947 [Solanum commersonii]|uniref:Uncharacterized protein n=1 Tax=Solanum commersonii TaxID=4109 RepID=A0A9J5ZDE6_SOLCO|nr:hypothetical protein H5410_021947 [Solanum commersonii]
MKSEMGNFNEPPSDRIHPLPRDTQSSLDFAKFGHETTYSHKNDVKHSIIGKNTSFGTNTSYLDFSRLDPTTCKHNPTNFINFNAQNNGNLTI